MGKYMCLRNCFVNVQLWKKDKVYELPDSMDKDPKNFRLVGVPAELHEEATEEELNAKHEAKMKVANKPEHIPEGFYWCTECQHTHRGTPNKNGKLGKLAKKHLKFRAE